MSKIIISATFLLISMGAYSQELIQNGDFEALNNEPCGLITTASEFDNAILYWQAANLGTPDIYLTSIDSICWNFQDNSTYDGPIGIKGSQLPHSGISFLGFNAFTISGLNQREYVQVEMNSPMIEGNEYIVEFYVSLADFIEFSVNNVGAYLSTDPVYTPNDGPLDFEAQVQFNGFIDDVENWVRIADTIVAGGNFNYITIGNFNNDQNTSTQVNEGGGTCVGCYGAYYFIDDVSVTPLTANNIRDIAAENSLTIYPNPFHSQLKIESESILQNVQINIYNAGGKLVFSEFKATESDIILDLNSLQKGVYFMDVTHKTGKQSFRLIKVED
jgi:hypothetical protein